VPGSLDRPNKPQLPGEARAADAIERMPSESRRPELPTELHRADQSALPGPRDLPGRWSKTDLRQRLANMALGHPSSLDSDVSDRTESPSTSDTDSEDPTADGDENREARSVAGREGDLKRPGSPEPPDGPGGPPPDKEVPEIHRNYWTELPRFRDEWAEHVVKWPDSRAAAFVDRSRDQAGSWRGDGDQYLSPEQHAEANDLIAEVAEAEKKLTGHMKEIEDGNRHGGRLVGLEHRLKGEERLKEKIAEKIEHEPGKSVPRALRQVADAVRYTFCFELDQYSGGYRDVTQRLESRDCRMIFSRNSWHDNPEYKGINTRWVSPDGQRFEVQFHTSESHHAKEQVTHFSYERLRNPLTSADERPELSSFQREVCSWIDEPRGVAAIADYRLKGRI
jgi:hypothetical protein